MHDTPANVILTKDEDGNWMKWEWHYCLLIGQIDSFPERKRLYIPFAFHQCAKYSIDSKQSHEEAVKNIGRYLNNSTEDKGLVFTPYGSNGLECFANMYFPCEWCREDTDQFGSVLSRTGYIIKFSNCPIVWVSKFKHR